MLYTSFHSYSKLNIVGKSNNKLELAVRRRFPLKVYICNKIRSISFCHDIRQLHIKRIFGRCSDQAWEECGCWYYILFRSSISLSTLLSFDCYLHTIQLDARLKQTKPTCILLLISLFSCLPFVSRQNLIVKVRETRYKLMTTFLLLCSCKYDAFIILFPQNHRVLRVLILCLV